MKKLIFTLAFIASLIAAQAQYTASINIGGSFANGSINTVEAHTGDTTYTLTGDMVSPTPLAVNAGVRFGYQQGRWQFGLLGNYSFGQTTSTSQFVAPNDTLISNYSGYLKTTQSAYSVGGYVRYEFLQAGDIALFAEINAYYAASGRPKNEQHIQYSKTEIDSTGRRIVPIVEDTTWNRDLVGSDFGVSIVPGVSWQITPKISLDLYVDLLALTFKRSKTTETIVEIEYDNMGATPIESRHVTTVTTAQATAMGFGITGTPLLSSLQSNNWVRIGLNITF